LKSDVLTATGQWHDDQVATLPQPDFRDSPGRDMLLVEHQLDSTVQVAMPVQERPAKTRSELVG
jgi:hypothetical protein